MRKRALLICPVLMLLIAGTAVAAHSLGSAKGNGRVESTGGFDTKVHFNASGTPEDGKGKVKRTVENSSTGEVIRRFEGKVTCYFQAGNIARFSGPITKNKVDDGAFEGQFFLWAVQDNGKGKGAPPDRFGAGRFATQPNCELPLVNPTQPVDKGDFKVDSDDDDDDD